MSIAVNNKVSNSPSPGKARLDSNLALTPAPRRTKSSPESTRQPMSSRRGTTTTCASSRTARKGKLHPLRGLVGLTNMADPGGARHPSLTGANVSFSRLTVSGLVDLGSSLKRPRAR